MFLDISKKLKHWSQGDISELWDEASLSVSSHGRVPRDKPSLKQNNTKGALLQAKEGHYGKAIKCLGSNGVISRNSWTFIVGISAMPYDLCWKIYCGGQWVVCKFAFNLICKA